MIDDEPAAMPSLREVLSDRSVIAYLLSVVAITAAVACQATALGLQVFDITHREIDLGFIGLAEFLPAAVLVIIAGTAADHFDRRRIAMIAFLGEGLCAAGLAYEAHRGVRHVSPIFLLIVIFGVARAFAGPAARSLPVAIVPAAKFPRLIAMNSASWQAGFIIGPVLAGFLYVISPTWPYVATAALCVISVAAMTLVRILPLNEQAVKQAAANAEPSTESKLHQAFEGLRVIRRTPVLAGTISLDLFAVLFGGAVALLPAIAERRLGVGALGLGWLRAAGGIGAALTTIVIAVRPLRRHVGPVLLCAVGVFGAATVALGLTHSYVVAFVAMLVLSGADAISVFVRSTVAPLVTPDSVRGRVVAVENVFIGASNELGAFESGVVGQLIGAGGAVLTGGLATIVVVGLWAAFFPGLRSIDRFSDL